MDKETVLNWLGSGIDLCVTKVLKQHWYERRYSYLDEPRPDHGTMLVLKGSVDFIDAHGTVSARAGDLVFLSKHSRYEAVFSDEVEDYLICFDTDDDSLPPSCPIVLSHAVDLVCFERIRTLSDENSYTVRSQLHNKGSFLLILDSIVEGSRDEGDEHSRIVKNACALLQKNDALSIEQLARECAVSTSLLRQLFVRRLGLSPIQYRTDIKLRRAMYLMEATDMTVSEIAETLSFFDAAYFCKVFRAHTGMTPTQYAKSKRI